VLRAVRHQADEKRDHEHRVAAEEVAVDRPKSDRRCDHQDRQEASTDERAASNHRASAVTPGTPGCYGPPQLLLEGQKDAWCHHEQERPEPGECRVAQRAEGVAGDGQEGVAADTGEEQADADGERPRGQRVALGQPLPCSHGQE